MPPVWSIPDHDKPVVVRRRHRHCAGRYLAVINESTGPHKRLSEPAGPSNRDILERYRASAPPADTLCCLRSVHVNVTEPGGLAQGHTGCSVRHADLTPLARRAGRTRMA